MQVLPQTEALLQLSVCTWLWTRKSIAVICGCTQNKCRFESHRGHYIFFTGQQRDIKVLGTALHSLNRPFYALCAITSISYLANDHSTNTFMNFSLLVKENNSVQGNIPSREHSWSCQYNKNKSGIKVLFQPKQNSKTTVKRFSYFSQSQWVLLMAHRQRIQTAIG